MLMRQKAIRIDVNNKIYKVKIYPAQTLLSTLRDDLKITSVKNGCDIGECGMCICLLDNKPVYSCITLAYTCKGKKIMTLEGLPEKMFNIIKNGFTEFVGLQCGFCTPAFEILTASMLLNNKKKPTQEVVKRYIDSALCRCTGYIRIWYAMNHIVEKFYE